MKGGVGLTILQNLCWSPYLLWDCKHDLIWKQGPCWCNEAKTRSYSATEGPNPMTSVLLGKGKLNIDTQGGNTMWRWGQRLKQCIYKSRNAMDCCQPPESRRKQGRILPSSFQRKHDHADTLILDLELPALWGNTALLFSFCFCSGSRVYLGPHMCLLSDSSRAGHSKWLSHSHVWCVVWMAAPFSFSLPMASHMANLASS